MRRRDPQESGMVTIYDAKDVFDLHNINFDEQTKFCLLEQFMISNGTVDYRGMWKFIMGISELSNFLVFFFIKII